MDIQFDILVAIYVDNALVSNNRRRNHPIPQNFQISQVINGASVDRLDLIGRRSIDANITHVYTRFNLADSNKSDAFYVNNPLTKGLMNVNMYANAKDVHKFYQVNIGFRPRPLIVLQLFYTANPSNKLKKYNQFAFL